MAVEEDITLKGYIDAQLEEVRRAVDVASQQPPPDNVPLRQYVEAILNEHRRAIIVADQERLRAVDALDRVIQGGDARLREHIANQVEQVRAALVSQELLAMQRHDSSERAIAKAEAANEERFRSVNEFREQLASQTQTFLPREVAEAQMAELRRAVADIAEKVSKIA